MKKIILISFSFLLLLSCDQVYVKSPQPVKGFKIKSFIDDLHGVYADSTLTVSIEKSRIVIDETSYELTRKDPGENEVLVKFYKEFYFANFRDSTYFTLFAGKFYDNKLAVFMMNADEFSLNRMKDLVEVEKLDGDGDYLIDPTASEFDKLLESSFFDVVAILDKEEN